VTNVEQVAVEAATMGLEKVVLCLHKFGGWGIGAGHGCVCRGNQGGSGVDGGGVAENIVRICPPPMVILSHSVHLFLSLMLRRWMCSIHMSRSVILSRSRCVLLVL